MGSFTEAQLAQEATYLDETEHRKQFPQLIADGKSVGKAELYLSVVVPCYNERERLPGMLEDAIATLKQREQKNSKLTWEIVIVDDGSRDHLEEVVAPFVQRESSERIRLLQLAFNQGKGAAVQKGALVSRGQLIYMADADQASKACELEKLERSLKEIEKDGYGVAIGSRAHLQDEAVAQRKWYRNILMHGFHALVYFVGGVRGIQDTQCGYKLFTRNSAAAIFASIHVRRWAFDVEVLRIAQVLSFPIAETPLVRHDVEGSKMNLKGMITMARDLFRIRLMYLMGKWRIPGRLPA